MDVQCEEALKNMDFRDVNNVIECFKNKKIDHKSLLLLKEFPENIPDILSELSDQLKLKKGLQSLTCPESRHRVTVSNDATSSISSNIMTAGSTATPATNDDVCLLLNSSSSGLSVVVIDAETIMFSPWNSGTVLGNDMSPPPAKKMRVESSTAEAVSELSDDKETQPQNSSSTYILDVFNKTIAGQFLVALSKKGGLDTNARCKIADHVVAAEYKDCNTRIVASRFETLAKLIVAAFPGESVETYFVSASGRGRGGSSSGKLYDCYTNTNRDLRRVGLRAVLSGPSSKKAANSGENPNVLHGKAEVDATVKAAEDYLRIYFEPWSVIEEYWKITAHARLYALRNPDCSTFKVTKDYINTFAALKKPGCHILLEHDFDFLFPDAKNRMETHWDGFSAKLKEQYSAVGLKNIEGEATLLFNFPRLFSVVPVRVPGKKPWRASRSEIQDGFLLHLKTLGELEKKIEECRKTAQLRGAKLQPFPVIIGEDLNHIISSYLILEDHPIRVESPKRAVELTFKAYYAIYCTYPVQSARLWIVFQKALFCINETVDSNVNSAPDVLRLISALRV